MTAKIAGVAALLFVVFPWSTPSSARAQVGAKCAQTIDRDARDTAALVREGKKIGIEFTGADAVGAAAAGLTPILETSTNPTLALAGKVQNYQEAIDAFQAGLEEFTVILNELVACMETDRRWGDCLSEFGDRADRNNKALGEFLLSLADLGTQAAVERAQKASSLLNNYMSRVADTAMKSAVDGVRACDEFQAKAAEQANAVDLRNPPTSQPKPNAPLPQPQPRSGAKGGGGLGSGTIAVGAITVGALAVAGGLVYASKAGSDCSSQESAAVNGMTAAVNAVNLVSACGTSSSCIDARMPAFVSAWNSWANQMGSWCSCLSSHGGLQVPADIKISFQQAYASFSLIPGINPGTFPSCFR